MARTILLADDSVTIQKVVELTFLDEDFRVVSFGNGADAVAALGEVRPDVVLADVHMPGADGYELCRAARAARPGTPVLLLVGTFEIFDPQRAGEVGASGHLKKPFDSQELLRRVQELVDGGAAAPAYAAPTAWAPPAPAPLSPPLAPEPLPALAPAPPVEAQSWSFEPLAASLAEPSAEAPQAAPEGAPEVGGWEAGEAAVFAPPEDEPVWEAIEEEPAPPPAAVAAAPALAGLSDADVERIARRVVELVGEKAVREVAWEVVPDLAELLLKARIRELEASVE